MIIKAVISSAIFSSFLGFWMGFKVGLLYPEPPDPERLNESIMKLQGNVALNHFGQYKAIQRALSEGCLNAAKDILSMEIDLQAMIINEALYYDDGYIRDRMMKQYSEYLDEIDGYDADGGNYFSVRGC